jgi:hypothetical protein
LPTYAQLNQRHPSHNEARRAELCGLYEGAEKLERLYPTLLPQRERERPQRYATRLKEAQYRNYLGPIIDYFASMLFVSRTVSKAKRDEKPVESPGDYWSEFREDCDRGGTDLDDLFKSLLTSAMVERSGWLRLHQPTDGGPTPESALDFEARKLGDCWVENLDGCDVLDWDTGEDGRLLWAVTHHEERKRQGLSGDRKRVVETWHYLTPESVETYRVEYDSDKKPHADDEIGRFGEPIPHNFGRVPLVCLDLPPALWVANRLRSPQLAHFRKVNALSWSLASTCYAMREYFVTSPDDFEKQISGAGYEIVLHKDDKTAWSAPPGDHFAALDTEIKAEKDEIFRIAHQMALGVENNAAAVGRSAESKASDAESTRVVLVAFSHIVRETIKYTLDLISRARGEDFTWSVEGLDDFAALDAAAFIENLKALSEAGRTIPSKTFQVAINERTAELLLPHMDEQLKTTVREEIQAGTTDPAEDAERERELAAEVFGKRPGEAPSGAKRPGKVAQPPKPPSGGDSGRAP